MGIKVTCPNGHKLNVKSFLAGKRGVCPHCGEKFDIPPQKGEEEAVGSVSSLAAATQGSEAVVSTPTAAVENRNPGTSVPAAAWSPASKTPDQPAAASPRGAPAAASLPLPVAPVHTPGSQPLPAALPVSLPIATATAVPAPLADPLAEAPEACWYVRPPSGGQYGPARANIMRQWINEGRVTPDSLVWREGWPDWKLAGETFTNLPPAAVGPAIPGAPMVQPSASHAAVQPASPTGGAFSGVVSSGPAAEPGRGPAVYRRKNKSIQLIALGFLFIALIVLTGLLVWVLSSQ
jgi:hypothetical protein